MTLLTILIVILAVAFIAYVVYAHKDWHKTVPLTQEEQELLARTTFIWLDHKSEKEGKNFPSNRPNS